MYRHVTAAAHPGPPPPWWVAGTRYDALGGLAWHGWDEVTGEALRRHLVGPRWHSVEVAGATGGRKSVSSFGVSQSHITCSMPVGGALRAGNLALREFLA